MAKMPSVFFCGRFSLQSAADMSKYNELTVPLAEYVID